MSKFNYTAIMLNGSRTRGLIEADNIREARTQLKARKLKVVDIKEKSESSLFIPRKRSKKLKADAISHFCRQFSIIMSSGINSLVGLETLSKKSENKVLAEEINRIVEDVRRGNTIADSMLDKKSKFPKLLGAMVATGEETGTLEQVLKSMATFYEKEHRINQKIKNASTYPIIVAVLAVAMLFLFTSFIIPKMMENLLSMGGELPLITKIVMGFGNFMGKWWWLVLIIGGVATYLLMQYIKTPIGRMQKDKLIDKIPLLGKGISSIIAMRFSRSLYLFVSTGYPMLQGLDHIKSSLNNAVGEKAIADAREGLMRGETLSENLEKSKYSDSVLIQMIAIGEQSGQLETISEQMADFYEYESDSYLTRLVAMIEPMMIIAVGIVVAILVLAIFLPMMSMYDAI